MAFFCNELSENCTYYMTSWCIANKKKEKKRIKVLHIQFLQFECYNYALFELFLRLRNEYQSIYNLLIFLYKII